MPKTLLLMLCLLSWMSCNTSKGSKSGNKVLDLYAFTVEVPNAFKYEKRKGIDSYVGLITNGEIDISFDYGWYSYPGPPTVLDKWIRRFPYIQKELKHLHSVYDVDTLDANYFQVLLLEGISTLQDTLGKYSYEIKYGNTQEHYVDTLAFNNIKYLSSEVDSFNVFYSFDSCKFYKKYHRILGNNESGVYMFRECDYRSKRGTLNVLGLHVSNYEQDDLPMIDALRQT